MLLVTRRGLHLNSCLRRRSRNQVLGEKTAYLPMRQSIEYNDVDRARNSQLHHDRETFSELNLTSDNKRGTIASYFNDTSGDNERKKAAQSDEQIFADHDGFRKRIVELDHFSEIYPDLLPDPDVRYRDRLKEKLERVDMLERRKIVHIPEFYVGSILAVERFDPKLNETYRFVGICILRSGYGLRSSFTLRNFVNGEGCEVNYLLYDPFIRTITCLVCEKRLDNDLRYLRVCDPKYSTFDFKMAPQKKPSTIRVNPLRLKLGNWHTWDGIKYERKNLKGIEIDMDECFKDMDQEKRDFRFGKNINKLERSLEAQGFEYEKYDLMRTYRNAVPYDDVARIKKHFDSVPTTLK